jgi:reactive intermediate/imine deaminase
MTKKIIHSESAPAAIGPYSQAVQHGSTIYLSGQIPLDPETMSLVEGDIRAQATRVFENLKAVLKAAGADMTHIVKLHIYLTDLSHFGEINELMKEYFDEPYPARAALGVKELPKGAQVEMDGIAVIG